MKSFFCVADKNYLMEFETLRQECRIANTPLHSVRKRQKSTQYSTELYTNNSIDNESKSSKGVSQHTHQMNKLCNLADIEPSAGSIGISLKYKRLQLGLSQQSLARMIGTSKEYVNKVEEGTMPVVHEMWQRIVNSTSQGVV